MVEMDTTVRILRENGESLVLDGLGLARAFFARDPSSQPGGYDSLAGKGSRDRIVINDVNAINSTMRARSPLDAWKPVLEDDQSWLQVIPVDLDIVQASDDEWSAANGDALLSQAIAACIRPGIGLAVATKMLHLKRPRLVPILDGFVVQMMGVRPSENPPEHKKVGQQLALALRREGHRNIQPLQRIQGQLPNEGFERTLIRILDAIIWYSHPAAAVSGRRRAITVEART